MGHQYCILMQSDAIYVIISTVTNEVCPFSINNIFHSCIEKFLKLYFTL